MTGQAIGPYSLSGGIVDAHAHVGMSIKAYANAEYPYCQSLEDLQYRQRANGVDYGVVFAFAPELYFDLPISPAAARAREASWSSS